MKIHVGEAFIEREKRDRPEHKMHVVVLHEDVVGLARHPGGTIAVQVPREDFERFWEPAPKYHKTHHPWRRQKL